MSGRASGGGRPGRAQLPRDAQGQGDAGRRLRILFAPDSFKGTLTSVEVARALASGWLDERPGDEIDLAPLADGGEGTLDAIAASGGWEWQTCAARDPLGRPAVARWLRSANGVRAVIELAEASGLSRLAPDEHDPLRATTAGTGDVLRAVLDAGVREVVLGIGGSATTDGGAGLLAALGVQFEPAVSLEGLDPRLGELRLRIACDVTNPLLGPTGAAATYGPQKGATPAQVVELDRRLAAYADALEGATGRAERLASGAGAAGGTAFGLLCLRDRFRSLELVSGVDLVAGETGLEAKLHRADLVVTGEGRIDAQTAFGKTALGVAMRARSAGIPCVAVGGGVESEGIVALERVDASVVPVHPRPIPLEEALAAGATPLVACGAHLARAVASHFRPLDRATP